MDKEIKIITEQQNEVFKLVRMFYMIESHAVLKYENTLLDYFPEEEMKKDFIWHNKQEKIHENGFKAFLKKHGQDTEMSTKEQKMSSLFAMGNLCEKYIDTVSVPPGQKHFSSINLFAYFSYLEYQETFAYRNYVSYADVLASQGSFEDLRFILKKFGDDELEHADYAKKWAAKVSTKLTSMADIKAKGNIVRHISQLRKISLSTEVSKIVGHKY